jgi:L-fuculose-phosphate aldolase
MSVPDVHHDVVRVALEMEAAGLVVGTAGNVSGRRADGTICLTPSSVPYRDITPEGLAVLDLDGRHLDGSGRPSTEKAMHLACYRTFPEVGGVVHCHPVHASMFAVANRPVPPAVEEALVYVGGSIPVARYAMTGSDELAAEVVRHLGDRSAVLMANHGMLCIGKDPSDALHTALVAEHTAHIVFGAQVLGGAVPLSDDQIASFEGIYRYLRGRWCPAV